MKTELFRRSFRTSVDQVITKKMIAEQLRYLADSIESNEHPINTNAELRFGTRFTITGGGFAIGLYEVASITLEYQSIK